MSRRSWLPLVSITLVVVDGNVTYHKNVGQELFYVDVRKLWNPMLIQAIKECPDHITAVLNRRPSAER